MKRLFYLILILSTLPLHAFGTYGEGKAIVALREFGRKGIFIDSYEGSFDIASYNQNEKCEDPQDCYTPDKESLRFSIREENKDLIQFMLKNMDRVMVIEYRIHRIKPIALSTSFEVLKASGIKATQAADFPWKYVSKNRTGSTDYSVYGKVLRLEYRGVAVGTYEGLLYDRRKDKVTPFSVTDEAMARHIYLCIDSGQEYNIGITRALVTGWRDSKLDVFEINYRERAGGVE